MSDYTHDYLILGAGPAGLQLGYYFNKAGLDYKIVESGSNAATTFNKFPRHRKLISINKIHTGYDDPEINLRWDWNSLLNDEGVLFKDFDQDYFPHADSMVRYLEHFAARFEIDIDFNQKVEKISREGDDGLFVMQTTGGRQYKGHKLIIATGLGKPNIPNIPGMELAECYTKASLDPQDYTNQHVLIIGKGNSAFEMADGMIQSAAVIHIISQETVRFAWQTHYVGDLRAVNNNFLDTYQLKSQNALLDGYIDAIEKRDGKYHVSVSYLHAHGEKEVLVYDKVINCAGFKFDDSLFDEAIRPVMCDMKKFPLQTNEWESANVNGMFFAGLLTHGRDYRKTTSGFIHGFRYNARALDKMLRYRYHNQPIQGRAISTDLDSLITRALGRINQSSALWQQFGFMADVIDMTTGADSGLYYEELPIAYVHENYFRDCDHYLTVSLEFGKTKDNPFAINRNPVPEKARESVFLHPVIRRFSKGQQISEFHLLEDLYAEWKNEAQHIAPLKAYLASALADGVPPTMPAKEVLQNAV